LIELILDEDNANYKQGIFQKLDNIGEFFPLKIAQNIILNFKS
jgi:hypothetical protein